MTSIERSLNSIGKNVFLHYYQVFKHWTDKAALVDLLTKDKVGSSIKARRTRVNYARWIFENNLQLEALDIIQKSKRLHSRTIMEAASLYASELKSK